MREATERGHGAGLPRFVEDEFREFLRCGVLAHGFARLRCEGCGLDRLLPFDVDVQACPACGGRLRLIATILDPRTIRAILLSLGWPTDAADRAPPAHSTPAAAKAVPGVPA